MTLCLIIFSVHSDIFIGHPKTANAYALIKIGLQPRDFALKTIDGKLIKLSELLSAPSPNIIVILFWSTWSTNSPKILKSFEKLYRKYKHKGLTIVGLNVDTQRFTEKDINNVKKVVKDLNISFPICCDKGLKIFRSYEVIALPSTIIVSDGRVSYELASLPIVGTQEMFDHLLTLLGEVSHKNKYLLRRKALPSHDVIADTNLGRRFVRKKMYSMAFLMFKKAIKKDSTYMLPYIELAKLYLLESNFDEAEKLLFTALKIKPNNVIVISELGNVLIKKGNIDKAIKVFEKAKRDKQTLSTGKGLCYYAYAVSKKRNQLKKALNLFEEAIVLNPFESLIYLLRGEVHENNNMLKKASHDYRKAVELILSH